MNNCMLLSVYHLDGFVSLCFWSDPAEVTA